ncbi:MAG: hypothetical protein DWI22_21575 [Planctomycetota bacterium]|nr:MAG: hypothetical protein DWI22_21575 [Planctomycetota bacterium]
MPHLTQRYFDNSLQNTAATSSEAGSRQPSALTQNSSIAITIMVVKIFSMGPASERRNDEDQFTAET